MALYFFDWQGQPGLAAARESYEAAFTWGKREWAIFAGGAISGATRDSGNTPTTFLRPGLVLGQITSSGQWTNYSPTATDGSQVAAGVLVEGVRITDIDGNNQTKFWGIHVGGPVKASKLIGLDYQARQQMRARFFFDDDYPGKQHYPWKQQMTKTAAYTAVLADNGTLFDNTGAAGTVTITLPAIQNGLTFGFVGIANQGIKFASNEGTNMVTFNNASANTVALATAGQIIGGLLKVYTNPAGTKWIVELIGQIPANLTIT